VRFGDERNYARVLERLQPYKDTIQNHEKNIQALQRELANLKTGGRLVRRPRPAGNGSGGARRRIHRALRQPCCREPAHAARAALVGQPFLGLFAERADLERSLEEAPSSLGLFGA
jgi:hypothetical protein